MPDSWSEQRQFFRTGQTRSLSARKQSLLQLKQAILAWESDLLAALHQDLGKSSIEAYTSEIGFVLAEIRLALKCLHRWMRPQRRKTPWISLPGRSLLWPEPKGLVLIMGPWNYPFGLLLSPLVSALAAGNCAVVKPSELAPATSQAIHAMLSSAMPSALCQTIEGGVETAQALLAESWDHIFFTGSTAVGRLVMEAASRTLSPVTLELGGKCPCIVCKDAPLAIVAERLVWGKFMNAGQTCVAPDHVWVHHSVKETLIKAVQKCITRFYGSNPATSPDYGRIISQRHLSRLTGYLQDGRVRCGGTVDATQRYLAPTLLDEPALESAVMQEEIFGPILPLKSFTDPETLVAWEQSRPRPLALYVFTRDRSLQEFFRRAIPAGGVTYNSTLEAVTSLHLPFGGRGESGMGAYHGQAGFDAFTHHQSVLHRTFHPRGRQKFPPYSLPLAWLKKIYSRLLA